MSNQILRLPSWPWRDRQKQEEQQYLYKFAELGQFSTALFHDLANNLAVLSLDIEGLKSSRDHHSFRRANQSLAQIERLVGEMRKQLQHQDRLTDFNPHRQVTKILDGVKPRFKTARVRLRFVNNLPHRTRIYGDRVRFAQVITVLLINALEATIASTNSPDVRQVVIETSVENKDFIVQVADWGAGVSEETRIDLFKPFISTKPGGMGIGLFITKQIIETHFKGDIKLVEPSQPTIFQVRIPRSKM